ncbi:MAG: LptF/LptG family permease [Brevinematia bacterium]
MKIAEFTKELKRFLKAKLEGCRHFIVANFIPFKRYDLMIYKELTTSYLVSFLIMSLVVWLKEIYLIYIQYIQKGAQLWTTLSIFFYSLPFTMAITIPAGMVMATLLTFNKLSINLEILMLRLSGVRKIRLFLPVFVFSLVILGITFLFFDTVLIRGNEMYLRSMIKMRIEKPFIDIAPGEFPKIGEFNIGFEEISGNEMIGVEIYQNFAEGERIIKASKGVIISSGDLPYYKILLNDGTFIEKSKRGEVFSSQFKEAELRVDYEISYIPTFNTETQPRVMSRYKTGRIIENMKKQDNVLKSLLELSNLNSNLIEEYKEVLLTLPQYLVALAFGGKERDKTIENFNNTIVTISKLHQDIRKVNTRFEMIDYNVFVFEQHKKTSIPVSAIVYGLVGFVFGIMIKVRTGRGGSLIIGIVVILLQTYLTFVAEIPVRNGELDPITAAWYSNVILSLPALYLLLREKI